MKVPGIASGQENRSSLHEGRVHGYVAGQRRHESSLVVVLRAGNSKGT